MTHGLCDLCGDNGLVTVPHPGYVVVGDWQSDRLTADGFPHKPTSVATCTCAKGRAVHTKLTEKAGSKGTKPVGLEEYRRNIMPDPLKAVSLYERDKQIHRGTYRAPTKSFTKADVHTVAEGMVPQ